MESRTSMTLYSYDTYTNRIRTYTAIQQMPGGYYRIEFDNGGSLAGDLRSFCSPYSGYGLTPRQAVLSTIRIKIKYLYRHLIILPRIIMMWFKLILRDDNYEE
jgi:hypothetical protein